MQQLGVGDLGGREVVGAVGFRVDETNNINIFIDEAESFVIS
jgi:hypothetical protein